MEYGLIGKPLKHSFSKEIHGLIAEYKYELREIDPSFFDEFMIKRDFKAINVTIPFKKKAFAKVPKTHIDARDIGAVNTIVNVNGELFGFNTDIYGVIGTFKYNGVDLKNKNVLILGTGATSDTVYAACKKCMAKNIYKAYRESSKVKGDVLYKEIESISKDINIIINTTSYGTYPNIFESPLIDLALFKKLEFVMDVVYNPLRTKLLISAEKRGIKTSSGLYMLIAQAVYASKLFLDEKIQEKWNANELFTDKQKSEIEKEIEKIYKSHILSKTNIVLTGMPSSGKSTLGEKIAKELDREFIDTDIIIKEKTNMDLGTYIEQKGEERFRKIESEVIKEIADKVGVVISTGGGAILNEENVDNLKLYGKIFFLNRNIDDLMPSEDRPLTKTKDQLEKVYNKRLPIYKKTCDEEIEFDKNIDKEVKKVLDKFK